MKILVDTADVDAIRRCFEYFPVDGVTTNPSILAAAGRVPFEVLGEIRGLLGEQGELHVQVLSRKAEHMVTEAQYIRDRLGQDTYIKVPVTAEGLKAIMMMKKQGMRVTATCVYTVQQAFLAAKAGADYAAPYVNRIENLGEDGVHTVERMQDLIDANGFETVLLAASFKNTHQAVSLAEYGVGAMTLPPEILQGMLNNACVDAAVEKFADDFEALRGMGATMLR